VAGRGPLDEAIAIMLAQLLEKHGLCARVDGVDAIARTNILHLETSGIAMVCVSYLDASSPAHMRYTIRRLRRRLPQARIMLGCWVANIDPTLRDTAKSDIIASTLRDALRLCVEAARTQASGVSTAPLDRAGATVDAA
jgi:hypothetical protein